MSNRDYSANSEYIIVLDKEPNGLIKRRIPIPNNHEEYINKLKILAEEENLSFDEFLKIIEEDEFWNKSLKHSFLFVRSPNTYGIPWEGIDSYSRYDLNKYLNLAEHCHFLKEYQQQNKTRFISEVKARILALTLNEMYEESDNLIKEGKRILYSHRKLGWNFPEYIFNENFSAGIETNFGFGNSSFFYVILKYKGLKIIPYLRLVEYPYANEFHFCYYTEKFELFPFEWDPAIQYCLDSFSLALNDEVRFINEFIISQAQGMVERLEFILRNEEFQFRSMDGSYYKSSYSGPQLVAFRAEKISHALLYIESIREFELTLNANLYSDKIIPINKKLYPILVKEIENYEKELIVLEAHKKIAEKELSEAINEENKEERYIKRFKEDFSSVFSDELFKLLFYSKFNQNQYKLIEEKWKKQSNYKLADEKYWYLYHAINKMKIGKKRIEEYFEKHELSLETA